MEFSIAIVKPEGHQFSECFREIAEALMYGLRGLGHQADAGFNRAREGAKHIILGAHLLNSETSLPPGSIMYNLEQLGAPHLDQLEKMGERFDVWDYSQRNVEKWAANGITAKHVPIGYVPELSRIKSAEQDIDVLFYGSINDRRRKVVTELSDLGLKVCAPFGLFGHARDCLIARSKVVLNVHFYPSKIFEIVRVSYLLANGKAVVTENSADTADYLDLYDGFISVPYERLVETCALLTENDDQRLNLGQLGLASFSKRDEREILRVALEGVA